MQFTDSDLPVAGRTLYGECRGEPKDGQIAVAWVIRNRADQPCWWGRSVTEVCLHPYQFSCWLKSDPNSAKLSALSDTDLKLQYLIGITKDVFTGGYPDPTNGATHYKVRGTKAQWDVEVEARGIKPVSIGAHDFFKIGPH